MTSSRIITCKCCGDQGRHGAHDWCHACYQRWRRAGRPDDGPPAPVADPILLARQAHMDAAAGRREDYAWLREEQRHSIAQAAGRLRVTYRTAQAYEALRKADAS